MTSAGCVPAKVTARGWSYHYPDRAAPAVRELDLVVEPGQRVLLLGASGAGKSTLLHALAGVLHDGDETGAEQQGALRIDGVEPHLARGRAGLMQQDPETQVVAARVGDDVAFGAENLAVPPDEIWPRVRESLAAVGLDVGLDHPTHHLSGGQKQRLALAGLLAMRPGLLLLDEPTANLDPDGAREVRDAVLAAVANTGATLLVVEHRVADWVSDVDRVIVLEPGGGVRWDVAPAALVDTGSVVRADLIASGVWVPDYVPELAPVAQAREDSLLWSEHLAVSPLAGRRSWRRWRTPRPRPVVSDVNVELRVGAAATLVGPNGAGKSTCALTLAGLLPPVSGRVVASDALRDGQTSPHPYAWRGPALVRRIGVVFQEPEHQFVANSVRDELAFGPRQAGLPDVDERVARLLARLRLDAVADANPYTLSGGEKRRLSVATMLATDPQVLVLDEPTFGQDAHTWRELAELLGERLSAGTAIVAVTHDGHFAAALGAASWHVADGRLTT